jgi:hypothetical protein
MTTYERLHRLNTPLSICSKKLVAVGESADGWMTGFAKSNGLINWSYISDYCNDKDYLVQLIKMAKTEAVYDLFFVTFGEAMWTLLNALDRVTAYYTTVNFIESQS